MKRCVNVLIQDGFRYLRPVYVFENVVPRYSQQTFTKRHILTTFLFKIPGCF